MKSMHNENANQEMMIRTCAVPNRCTFPQKIIDYKIKEYFPFNLYVLFVPMAPNLLGYKHLRFFGPNHSMSRAVFILEWGTVQILGRS